jgi:hypothetical protein
MTLYASAQLVLKEPSFVSAPGSSREAITQLIGLNLDNPYHSPPVLLTNLVKTHHVYYIKRLEEFPWFGVCLQNCNTVLSALQFVETLKDGVVDQPHFHFGRSTTPCDE